MDAFMKKIEMLAAKAALREDPKRLNALLVMDRIRALPAEAEEEEIFPLRLFAGATAAVAAAAAFVFIFAASAWVDFNSPLTVMDSLMDVMETML